MTRIPASSSFPKETAPSGKLNLRTFYPLLHLNAPIQSTAKVDDVALHMMAFYIIAKRSRQKKRKKQKGKKKTAFADASSVVGNKQLPKETAAGWNYSSVSPYMYSGRSPLELGHLDPSLISSGHDSWTDPMACTPRRPLPDVSIQMRFVITMHGTKLCIDFN
jgi:hypothetical protein